MKKMELLGWVTLRNLETRGTTKSPPVASSHGCICAFRGLSMALLSYRTEEIHIKNKAHCMACSVHVRDGAVSVLLLKPLFLICYKHRSSESDSSRSLVVTPEPQGAQ